MLIAGVRFFPRGDIPDKLHRNGAIDAANVNADTEEESEIIPYDREAIGQRFQAKRLRLQQTEADVGAVLDVTGNHISRIERGVVNCTLENFCVLVQYYGCSADEILFGEHERKDRRGVDEFSEEQREAVYALLSVFGVKR